MMLFLRANLTQLKAHSRNIKKVIDISFQAYLLSTNKLKINSILDLKINEIHNLSAFILGFKSFAALQAAFSKSPLIAVKKINEDKIAIELSNLLKCDLEIAKFITKNISYYMVESELLRERDSESHGALKPYLPMLKYLNVKGFSKQMRMVVENSYTFVTRNLESKELSIESEYPFIGWINVCILNNIFNRLSVNENNPKDVKILVKDLFGGSPRMSQLEDILVYLTQPQRIGVGYYSVDESIDEIQLSEDHLITGLQIKINIEERSLAIIQKFEHQSVKETVVYDSYGIKDLFNKYKEDVNKAKIFEASDYFLTICFNHLQDINPIIHLNTLESMLSVRDESVNEISWRLHVTDYAEALILASKQFIEELVDNKDDIDVNRCYFNQFGFLMFESSKPIKINLLPLVNKPMSDYDFSIFLNLFLNLLIVISTNKSKVRSRHLESISTVMFGITKELVKLDQFKPLSLLFDLRIMEKHITQLKRGKKPYLKSSYLKS
jgi:hypothetical protein